MLVPESTELPTPVAAIKFGFGIGTTALEFTRNSSISLLSSLTFPGSFAARLFVLL